MRCDQFIGLNERAISIVEKLEKGTLETKLTLKSDPDNPIFDKKEVEIDRTEMENADSYEGMYGIEYPLYKYILPSGAVYIQFVQEAYFSSGPVIFLALKDVQGETVKESLWTEEEMQLYL